MFLLLTLPVPWGSVKMSTACELVQTLFCHPKEKRKKRSGQARLGRGYPAKPWPIMLKIFTYYAFEQCSKVLPIMLNIMPATTTIIYSTVHTVFILMTVCCCISIVIGSGCCVLHYAMPVFLYLTCYAHEKTCASFYTMLA